ncbi:hypothetical protein J6590_058171 [Homalodisca vitripennis]|nr:hypothetical protein J6590_058171 [Homalodisca vitripennis]
MEPDLPPVAEEPPGEQESPREAEVQESRQDTGTGQEIQQESIKEALKEIITEIEEAVIQEAPEIDQPVMTSMPVTVNGFSTESQVMEVSSLQEGQGEVEVMDTQIVTKLDRQTSTTSLAEFAGTQREETPDVSPLRKLFPSLFKDSAPDRPVSLPSATELVHLWQSLQIAQELNTMLKDAPKESAEDDEIQDILHGFIINDA